MTRHSIIVDGFFDGGRELRQAFDARMSLPRAPRERFIWDYWHVPKYTYLRSYAPDFFPQPLLAPFVRRLKGWAFENLGVSAMDTLWLSYYIDGCRQDIHHDDGNGQWAFVYSLTDWESRAFDGGETFITDTNAAPAFLWNDVLADPEGKPFELIEPKFGRLVVFDSRVPHGVRPATGVRDPLRSRIVLHGWIGSAGTIVRGSLRSEQLGASLERTMDALSEVLGSFEDAVGMLIARLTVEPSGEVSRVVPLTNTLVAPSLTSSRPEEITQAVVACLRAQRFPDSAGPTEITIPLDVS